MSSNLIFTRSSFRAAALGWVCAALISVGAVCVRATTVVPPEFPTLVNESDYIVHVVTKNVTAEKRVGPRGAKIFTRVELEIIEVVAGTPPPTLTLEFLGGRVGEEAMTVGGMPQFRVGNEDILFVRGNGQSICPLYAMMHGRYIVSNEPATGRKYMMRSDGEPLRAVSQISTALSDAHDASSPRQRAASASALQANDFVQQIKAAIRPGARLHQK